MSDRTPLTLVTGYLGAGKTTLLNALLGDPGAGRLAVIVNEFGDVGLDHELIVEATETTVLLASGCLCCSVRGDLIEALESLLEQRARGGLAFDRIVIETTGLADPAPILHTLIVTPALGGALRLDGVITVCDAVNGPAALDAGFESVAQVAMADVLVISKSELVDPLALRAFQARLSALAPGARQLLAARGAVPAADIFGHGTPGMEGPLPEALDWVNAPAYAMTSLPLPPFLSRPSSSEPDHGLFAATAVGARAAAPPARHDDRISAVSATFDDPILPGLLDLWMETLIAARGPDILRLKAVIWIKGFDTPFVIHGVQHVIDPPVRLARWQGADRKSRVVIIGRDLPRDLLLDSLDVLRTQLDARRA